MIYGNQEKWSSIPAGTVSRSTAPGSCGADGHPGGYHGLPFAIVANETPVK
jgi:hypothetical protein